MNIIIRPAVGLVLYDSTNKRFLILRRNPRRYIGWGLVKGGIDEGETAEQACLRETAEEVGLTLCNTDLHKLGHKCAYYDNPNQRIVLVEWFVSILKQQPPLTLERDEWTEARWATFHETLYELVWQSQQHATRIAHEYLQRMLNFK